MPVYIGTGLRFSHFKNFDKILNFLTLHLLGNHKFFKIKPILLNSCNPSHENPKFNINAVSVICF